MLQNSLMSVAGRAFGRPWLPMLARRCINSGDAYTGSFGSSNLYGSKRKHVYTEAMQGAPPLFHRRDTKSTRRPAGWNFDRNPGNKSRPTSTQCDTIRQHNSTGYRLVTHQREPGSTSLLHYIDPSKQQVRCRTNLLLQQHRHDSLTPWLTRRRAPSVNTFGRGGTEHSASGIPGSGKQCKLCDTARRFASAHATVSIHLA